MHILMQIIPAMDQPRARERIQHLVEKFRREQAAGVIGQYNESETKTGFIEPLLQALGWNTQDRNEVGLEEKISGGRVHYSHESCQVQCSKRGALV